MDVPQPVKLVIEQFGLPDRSGLRRLRHDRADRAAFTR
jgi:hypothetical protein